MQAAYIWKHHKSSKASEIVNLKELGDSKTIKTLLKTKKRKVKYLIVGGGTAGFSAIKAIKEADPEAQVKKI